MLLFQIFRPSSIRVSLVSQQTSMSQRKMILENLLCGRTVTLRGARDHQGQQDWQPPRPAGHSNQQEEASLASFTAGFRLICRIIRELDTEDGHWEGCYTAGRAPATPAKQSAKTSSVRHSQK